MSRFRKCRDFSRTLCEPLQPEDYIIQAMPDTSPPKWHLAHTTWFFEQFILRAFKSDYKTFDDNFSFLFNSYYETVGTFHPRPKRGVLSRPNIQQVWEYRNYVDTAITELLASANEIDLATIIRLVEIGTHHEEQHQELLLMDVKYNLFSNPLYPAYLPVKSQKPPTNRETSSIRWLDLPEGIYDIGADTSGFCYDNERALHKVYINGASLSHRLITNGEYLEFILDGGYQKCDLWLSEGWQFIKDNQIEAPLYWIATGDRWQEFSLHGPKSLDLHAPVCHLSYYEADAFARWYGARLPSEFEWEALAKRLETKGNLLENLQSALQPAAPRNHRGAQQFFGDCWEWTASAYAPYPNFHPEEGALGEYNGKFMVNQYVLRGGCCLTPAQHIRATYRNFFPASSRWMVSGLRLAKES